MRHTNVRQHHRKTKKGRTTVKKHNRKVRKNMPTLFHVTKKENIPSIMEKGLFPQKPDSVFGEESRDDPKAVYTFFGNRVLEVEPAIKDFKYPSESAFLRKQRKNKDLKPPRPIVLEIGLSDEEFKERRLHHSYGAKGVESPIRGHIHPSRIRFRKEIDKKLLRKKASFEDYHKIAEVRTPKAQMEIAKQLAERPEIGFREIFK